MSTLFEKFNLELDLFEQHGKFRLARENTIQFTIK